VAVTLLGSSVAAKRDPRWAAAKTLCVIPDNGQRDDWPVAQKLAEQLRRLHMTVVIDPDQADLVLRVKAHISGYRSFLSHSVSLYVEAPNGDVLYKRSELVSADGPTAPSDVATALAQTALELFKKQMLKAK
jgi:hypothetical protein